MKIIEYRLHGNPAGQGMITPGFLKHGGFYQNPENRSDFSIVSFSKIETIRLPLGQTCL